jgi:ubiquinol-cytochrome c reductase iron-sulfur subunit
MNPAADVLALANLDVDLKDVAEGQTKTLLWRGKPVFVRHRTKAEIDAVDQTPLRSLKDPQTDKERFSKDQNWLIVVGVCTHLGCVPGEKKDMGPLIKEGGWLCACHGSRYDISGRIISGPAPKNLEVPPYEFVNNGKTLRIG